MKHKDPTQKHNAPKSPTTRMWAVQAVPVNPHLKATVEGSMYLRVVEKTNEGIHGVPIRTKTANAAARKFIRGMFDYQKSLFQSGNGPYGLRVDFE